MNIVVSVLITLLAFSVLVFIHELGHFLFARLFHVTVKEFAIGMGPTLLWYEGKGKKKKRKKDKKATESEGSDAIAEESSEENTENATKNEEQTGTRYSLRMFPIGGFVSMVGEDEESDDPNAFCHKKAWQRFIITAAGAVMNFLLGFVIMIALVVFTAESTLGSTTVAEFLPTDKTGYEISSEQSGLRGSVIDEQGNVISQGDTILAVNGNSVHIANELSYEIMRNGIEPVTLTILRDGVKMDITVEFPVVEESGSLVGCMDFRVFAEEASVGNILKHAFYRCTSTVRIIWESLFDMVTGRYSVESVSGPIGTATVIGESIDMGAANFFYLMAIISINLGIVNLLPLPALDGGRLIFLLIEMIRRKPISPKIEGVIHFVGIVLLMGLMLLITFKDIFTLL